MTIAPPMPPTTPPTIFLELLDSPELLELEPLPFKLGELEDVADAAATVSLLVTA